MGVQRDAAVVVQLAEGDFEPVSGADADNCVDGEGHELAFAQPGAGQQLDHQAHEGAGIGSGRPQQLGRGGIVDEPGWGLVGNGQVTGEDQRPVGGVGVTPFGHPLEEAAQREQPSPDGMTVQHSAAEPGPLGKPGLVSLDVVTADVGYAGDLRRLAGQERSQLPQRPLSVADRGGPQAQLDLGQAAASRRRQDRATAAHSAALAVPWLGRRRRGGVSIRPAWNMVASSRTSAERSLWPALG